MNPSLASFTPTYASATASTIVVNATFGAVWAALVAHLASFDVGVATAGHYKQDLNRVYQLVTELDRFMVVAGL